MKMSKYLSITGFCLLMAACVTVNVYFPAAAAEKAVDKFVKDVYGDVEEEVEQEDALEGETSSDLKDIYQLERGFSVNLLSFLVSDAQAAQPNIDIATPATNKLKSSMTARHRKLTPFYGSGAVGMTGNALLVVRNAKAVPLKQRNAVKQLVAEENRDRNQLYKAIAVANKHPEWESEIRSLFARRWIANAPGGWWYNSGGWKQK